MLSNAPTLGEYLEFWLATYCCSRLAANTVRGYRVNIQQHITPYIGSVAIGDLTPDMIDNLYYVLRCKGLSGTSVLYVHSVLRKALNTALKRRMLKENILDFVDSPRKDRYKSSFIGAEQMRELLSACYDTELYVPLLLMLAFGLRRGETLGITWADCDFKNGILNINRTVTYYNGKLEFSSPKTSTSRRSLLMPLYLSLELRRWKVVQPPNCEYNLICTKKDGSALTPNRFQKLFKKALNKAGLPDVRIHDLRHSYATLMLENNINPKIVCEILGHSSVDVTLDIYSHALTNMQRPAADVINGVLSSQLDFNAAKNA